MNKIRKYIPKIVILDTAIYIWIFVMLHLILQCFGLKFREWVYWMSVLLMMMGFITGIIQLILKLKKRIVKICIMSTFVILLLISSPIFYLIVGFGYTPEHVVEKDGSKYVAYVNSFLRTYVYYYDYKNVVVVGNQKRIVEDYGKGEIYDENDEIIAHFVKTGDNEYEVSGELSISDMLENLDMPEDKIECSGNSVGGWIMELLGHVAVENETVQSDIFKMTVLSMEDQKILKIRLEIVPKDTEENISDKE